MERVLVTGTAGFIGFHLSQALLAQGRTVIGLDNLNDYYDPSLKEARLHQLKDQPGFTFYPLDISDREVMGQLFSEIKPDKVAHLAAQAGVRYSLKNPYIYVDSNVVGTLNILEGCRQTEVKHLVFASSSSVYGANIKQPFSVHDNVDHPISLYAATKKSAELMAHSYSYLYKLPITGLRLFTVYGPWGRPDMALFLFTKSILEGQPINVFNHGLMRRDFTYVGDIVEGIVRVLDRAPQPNPEWSGQDPDPGSSSAPYRIYNLGNHQPVELIRFIEVLEDCIGQKALKNMLPMQPGDVLETYADMSDLQQEFGWQPNTPLEVGIQKFVDWYRDYYQC